ncbi:unnamed protein product [Leptidea sinapis]|uniref:Coatomer subunit beta n=1 Tax=Leptidea sinapis TaxID=189913 RepID=A0A5E4Q0D5_9NEOP|nr:unnamed protein product [Leptidea sinapis]
MAGVEQPCYTLINFPTDSEPYNEMQLKIDLEKGDIKKKIEALKKTIGIILSGEKIPGLLMIIIRFVLPLQDHTIKKLLLIFWEIVPKTTADGKLMQEMILVCDAYRKDLQHPNEFLRGSTLRFLCKLKEPELLEPLMPAIRACLDHRHSYVRRNAVLAIFTIYRNFEFLIPDAPELVANFLENEQDMSCKRNAFLMLLHADQEKALSYLSSRLDSVHGFGDILQLVIVELIYKVCHANPGERSRFIRTVYGLLNASSPAVRYEAAGTLVTLSNAPAAIKLIVKESDNNVKLIVVGKLRALRADGGEAAARALPDLAMDVLRVLAASDLDVRRQTLHLALELATSRHAEELVSVLCKEAARAHSADHDDAHKYRQLLVRALHRAALKFPEVLDSVAPALLEMVGDGSEAAAADVMVCPRGQGGPSGAVAGGAEEEEQKSKSEAPARQLVTSDGAYATQSAFNLPQSSSTESSKNGLAVALGEGDSFTAACACSALSKLALRCEELASRALHLAAQLMALHKVDPRNSTLTADDWEHCAVCVWAGAVRPAPVRDALLEEVEAKKPERAVEVEQGISFSALAGGGATPQRDMFEVSLSRAVSGRRPAADGGGKLSRVRQLTGFSDPVYAEAIVSNCTVELATLGELRLVERPAPLVLAPRDFASIRAHVKVASTENGIVFGNIVYEVSVNTGITDLREYLDHLRASTNMKCLTPDKDALANLSIESPLGRAAPVTGHVRIRAKTQGMALSLGDKINTMQKSIPQKQHESAIPAA